MQGHDPGAGGASKMIGASQIDMGDLYNVFRM